MKDDKHQYERGVFDQFVLITGLNVDFSTIVQFAPPAPDISCSINRRNRHFELTRLTDEGVEAKVLRGIRGYRNFRISLEDVLRAVQKKTKKRYVSDGPIDLVIHEGATPIDGLWMRGEKTKLKTLLRKAAANGPFARVWLVDFSSEDYVFVARPR